MEGKGFSDTEIKEECKKARLALIEENNWQHLFKVKLGKKPAIPELPKDIKIHELTNDVKPVKEEELSVPVSNQKTKQEEQK